MKTIWRCGFLLALTLAPALHAHDVTAEMSDSARAFLASLPPEQRAKAVFEMKDAERVNWHFVPRTRAGLPFKEMTAAQRQLAHALLNSGMSHRGYTKALTIMSLDQILFDLENGNPRRDPELYYVTIFGTPSETNAWGWRVEGHHLSLNFTVAGQTGVAVAPSFFGSNPATVQQGPRRGLRTLGREEELARELVKSLSEKQRKVAIINETAPRDIITGNSRNASRLAPDGLAASKLTAGQRKQLRALLDEYVRRFRAELAERDLQQIEDAGWEKIFFAWAGGTGPGQGHYYRVQGPTFLLEYDNTQNNANHIHTVWRDLKNDFGDDLLRRHYEQTPHDR